MRDQRSVLYVAECGNGVQKLPFPPGPAFNDEIRALCGAAAGFYPGACAEFLHGVHELVLPALPVHVDYQKEGRPALRNQLQKEQENGHHQGNEQRKLIIAGAQDDSDADGPEKEKHIRLGLVQMLLFLS